MSLFKKIGPGPLIAAAFIGPGTVTLCSIAGVQFGYTLLWALLFVFIKLPVLMVLTGGIVGSFLLFLVVYAVIHFRYLRGQPLFKPGFIYDLTLWVSILSILGVGILGIFKLFS